MNNPNITTPFVQTHTRIKDGLSAMLMADRDETALYRVQFDDIDRITSCSSSHFNERFQING